MGTWCSISVSLCVCVPPTLAELGASHEPLACRTWPLAPNLVALQIYFSWLCRNTVNRRQSPVEPCVRVKRHTIPSRRSQCKSWIYIYICACMYTYIWRESDCACEMASVWDALASITAKLTTQEALSQAKDGWVIGLHNTFQDDCFLYMARSADLYCIWENWGRLLVQWTWHRLSSFGGLESSGVTTAWLADWSGQNGPDGLDNAKIWFGIKAVLVQKFVLTLGLLGPGRLLAVLQPLTTQCSPDQGSPPILLRPDLWWCPHQFFQNSASYHVSPVLSCIYFFYE